MTFKPINPEDRRKQWIWFSAFVVVFGSVSGAQVWSNARDRAAYEEFEAKLTGADNYCYFEADFSRPQPGGGYEWKLINNYQRPIPNIQVCLYFNGEFTRCWRQSMCLPHAIDQAKEEGPIKIGEHKFEFFGANSWSQTLKIYMDGDMPKQIGRIIRNNEEIGRVADEPR